DLLKRGALFRFGLAGADTFEGIGGDVVNRLAKGHQAGEGAQPVGLDGLGDALEPNSHASHVSDSGREGLLHHTGGGGRFAIGATAKPQAAGLSVCRLRLSEAGPPAPVAIRSPLLDTSPCPPLFRCRHAKYLCPPRS